jgi:hypothetical protein
MHQSKKLWAPQANITMRLSDRIFEEDKSFKVFWRTNEKRVNPVVIEPK